MSTSPLVGWTLVVRLNGSIGLVASDALCGKLALWDPAIWAGPGAVCKRGSGYHCGGQGSPEMKTGYVGLIVVAG